MLYILRGEMLFQSLVLVLVTVAKFLPKLFRNSLRVKNPVSGA